MIARLLAAPPNITGARVLGALGLTLPVLTARRAVAAHRVIARLLTTPPCVARARVIGAIGLTLTVGLTR